MYYWMTRYLLFLAKAQIKELLNVKWRIVLKAQRLPAHDILERDISTLLLKKLAR